MFNGRSSLQIAVLAAVLVAMIGCSSAAPVRFHTLMPADTAPRAAAADGASALSIVVEPIRLPAQVDQPQWLVRLPDGGVALLEQDRWASALRDEFRQALVEQLNSRYGLGELRGAPAEATFRLAVDIRRFDSVPGRQARLDGSWTVSGGVGRARVVRCEWSIREASASPGTPALAAAHRRIVARLGEAIGDGMLRQSRNQAVTCPASDSAG